MRESRRDLLVVFLAAVSGLVDAFGFVGLGGSFTSVMTGNMVLLGVHGAEADISAALQVGIAIASYVVGTAVGTRIAGAPRPDDGVWPPRVTVALGCEAIALGLSIIGWLLSGGRPGPDVQALLLSFDAVGLGIQSAAIQRFGVSGLSTTYLTGTLTTVVTSLVNRAPLRTVRRSILLLVALIAGAAASTVLLSRVRLVAALFLVVPLLLVIVVERTSRRARPKRPTGPTGPTGSAAAVSDEVAG